ncbi:MAG: prepilin-type N-terminal cleavage/methylation domain-containing protein [Ruminococcaceae bacterium]|nr:prepilin-type N-terminal cleavage/methylation domain-containing protein [Oscillospiraceae bacterium]
MKNKGFSLVELIVVIAIMAILVGVAVPVYTSYIEKTQKNKDIQMVDEIKHAIEIAAVGESWYQKLPNGGIVGAVVITDAGTTVVKANGSTDASQALLVDALEKTFGEFSSLKLSYDGWTGGTIAMSSYAGYTSELLGDVQMLTNAFKDWNTDSFVTGTGFGSWMGDGTYNAQEKANLLALYVAEKTTGIDEDEFQAAWNGDEMSDEAFAELGAVGFVAIQYAKLEAMVNACDVYCTCDNPETTDDESIRGVMSSFEIDMTGVEDSKAAYQHAMNEIDSLFDVLQGHLDNGCAASVHEETLYTSGQSANDASAFLEVMNTVKNNGDLIRSDLDNENLYGSEAVVNVVTTYMPITSVPGASEGDVVVIVTMDNNGAVSVQAYPIDQQ